MEILEKVKEVKGKAKKRNFTQKFDLIINLKDIDLDKAENKIDEICILPKGSGKDASVLLFLSETEKIENCKVIKGSEIENLGKNKKKLKKLISQTDFFLSEPKLMPEIGKHLGKYLAPRGLMPKPVGGDVKNIIQSYKKAVRISIKKQPVIHTIVGSEAMKEEDIVENIQAVLNFLNTKLPGGKNNISEVLLKLTMSSPVRIKV